MQQQPDGKNPEEQYVRNALSQLGKPSLWFSDITCSSETTQIPSLCSEVGCDSLFVRWQRAQSVPAHPRLLSGNISICFPSVKRRLDASRPSRPVLPVLHPAAIGSSIQTNKLVFLFGTSWIEICQVLQYYINNNIYLKRKLWKCKGLNREPNHVLIEMPNFKVLNYFNHIILYF